ncbi:DUF47 family protein [Micromonospora sp. NPDC049559]|uniref:DUF47 domain-containing protein n=1 Tax=Micromonospora sp. NPDC049559 TaxID=3155923 RepID=UPI0034246554
MTGGLGRLLRDLTGRTDRTLADLVVAQVTTAASGADVARAVAGGAVDPKAARERMAEVEHEGDALRARLVAALRRSVSSPIDREDLFRLSRSVDDVLDALRDFVRETDLFAVPPQPVCGPVLEALAAGLDHLAEAVRLLPARPRLAADRALTAKKCGVRPAYQRAVCALLDRRLDADVIKATLLLGRLDVAGQQLAAAADALADGVVKRFQ